MILFAMKGRHADKNKQGAPDDNDGGGGGGGGYAAATAAGAVGDNDDDNGADDDKGGLILFAMKERHWCGRAQAGQQGTGGGSFCSKWPWIGNPEEYKTRISFDSTFSTPFLSTRYIYYILYLFINQLS